MLFKWSRSNGKQQTALCAPHTHTPHAYKHLYEDTHTHTHIANDKMSFWFVELVCVRKCNRNSSDERFNVAHRTETGADWNAVDVTISMPFSVFAVERLCLQVDFFFISHMLDVSSKTIAVPFVYIVYFMYM